MRKTYSTDTRGFTMIELMMVIAIIGILSAIAIPRYAQYVESSRATAVAADTKIAVDATSAAFAAADTGESVNILSTINNAAIIGDPLLHSHLEFISGTATACGQIGFSPSVVTPTTSSVTLSLGNSQCSSTQESEVMDMLRQDGIQPTMPAETITVTARDKVGA